MSKLMIEELIFACRAAAVNFYGTEPDYVDRYAYEAEYGSLFVEDEVIEPQPSNTQKVIAVIDGLEFYCKSEAAKFLGVTKATLARKLKTDNVFDTRRQRLNDQVKPMFHKGQLYPSPNHVLKADNEHISHCGIKHSVKLLNQRVRRAMTKGETLGISLDGASAKLGIDKPQYVDEFGTWVDMVRKRVGNSRMAEMFYCYKPLSKPNLNMSYRYW